VSTFCKMSTDWGQTWEMFETVMTID
jgi:hypothetical protein